MLSKEQVKEFAERGFLVVPGAAAANTVRQAHQRIDALLKTDPPPEGHVGNHFYFPPAADEPALIAPLTTGSPSPFDYAQSLAASGILEEPWQVQVALNIPPFPHRPGRPHIDAQNAEPNADLVPSTFTLLAGVFVTDQTAEDSGNLWVWPGTHRTHAEYFQQHGVSMFCAYPDIELPEPEQIKARAGDLLLAHYLLGHNIGGNFASETIRRMLYYRISATGHSNRPERILTEPWYQYDAVRALL